jgi:hydroxymethylpyrimidine/phosphomethylpyrimidine kinase
MNTKRTTAAALTIAGSDSGGGAGIQADLKTFTASGVFGTSAITCVTAQNPGKVSAVHAIPVTMVIEQMERVLEAFPVRGIKTGMLFNTGILRAVARYLSTHKTRARLVVDPVMVASSGAMLLQETAVRALCEELIPLAAVITPNLSEAEVLWGRQIRDADSLRRAAETLGQRWGVAVLAKGGHLPGAPRATDMLWDGRRLHELSAPVTKIRSHGTGCTLSAAIAAQFALGRDLVAAVRAGKRTVTRAIERHVRVGRFDALNP